MLKSMTGYGSSSFENEQINFKVEVKSINSKSLDISLYYPKWLSSKEIEWRSMAHKILNRGKINISILLDIKNELSTTLLSLSKESFKTNYDFLKGISSDIDCKNSDFLQLALKYTLESTNKEQIKLSKKEINCLDETIFSAMKSCDANRELEGKHLYSKFKEYIVSIESLLKKVEKYAPKRLLKIRSKIETKISELSLTEKFDNNRFEQEILYYIEKLDIEEEVIRLDKHLSYFLEIMDNDESYCGKKLGFIIQEIGREINTIGSKANDTEIQKDVVAMKEEVEKIREQIQNIL